MLVTEIRRSWKQSLQGMSNGATSMIRRPKDSPWNGVHLPKKCRLTKSRIKALLLAFFDSKGLIHHEFVPAGFTIVNAESYEGVLKRLLQRIWRVRPQLYQSGLWKLLHDNTRPHTAIRVGHFLTTSKVKVLEHPPFSPDLATADFLFLASKET
ncbi:hypothetical protein AVEN_265385-1 [Araneus ventricosus]|uniref:Mariner Mos1 transposase n=1 Tax=Araneus ventricosus TaxID=182803 RepID=A0A4Y2WD30_ARAVE|nr:hypothetical protein AVEN_265385-1 [Araneus ventricosus]